MPVESLDHIDISVELQQSINADLATYFSIVPKSMSDEVLCFYIDKHKANNLKAIQDELEIVLNKKIILETTESHIIRKALSVYYRNNKRKSRSVSFTNSFLEELIFEAKDINASDIHIEVYELEQKR